MWGIPVPKSGHTVLCRDPSFGYGPELVLLNPPFLILGFELDAVLVAFILLGQEARDLAACTVANDLARAWREHHPWPTMYL